MGSAPWIWVTLGVAVAITVTLIGWYMAIGLAVIVACLAAGIYLRSSEAKIFVGAVAAVGAAFSGFLNRTYIHMYGQTLGQSNRYFDQPVLTGYYLTAERLAQDLPDNPEGEMRRMIIQQVLQYGD